VPDALANILLISSIPFAFFLFGKMSFSVLFLWSSILHLMFYVPLGIKTRLLFYPNTNLHARALDN